MHPHVWATIWYSHIDMEPAPQELQGVQGVPFVVQEEENEAEVGNDYTNDAEGTICPGSSDPIKK